MGYILVVEDDDTVREMMRLTLEYYGLTAKTASGIDDSIDYMKQDRPDLIILDYMLKEGTADPIIEAAKKMMPTTPIIMCSAWHKIEEITHSKGLTWVLKKPFEIEALGDMLKQILPGAFTDNKIS